MLELKDRDGLGCICELTTPHGKVETPSLLPVINPNRMVISPGEMRERFGIQILITNAYIILNDAGLKQKVLDKGIHDFLGFDGPIMTDSGTFQTHVYGDLGIDQKEILKFQMDIGVDIGTMLDVFIEPDEPYEEVKRKLDSTLQRSREAVDIWDKLKEGVGKGTLLNGVVQGSVFPDLREECAKQLSEMPFDVHPIGGVVPLMENYRYSELVDIVLSSKKGLRPDRPVHLFGAGHPMLFGLAVLLGCDLFDSASYAKYASDGRMMFTWGTRRLEDLKYQACECPVCTQYAVDELNEERIAMHNLYVSFGELRRIKQAIHEGSLWDLVEQRARHHPSLLAALRRLSEYGEYLERFEPLSRRGALFYTGAETLLRPAISRYRKRLLTRYERPAKVLVELEELNKPYSRYCADELRKLEDFDAHIVVKSTFGPVPIELDEMYPVAQSLAPENRDLESVVSTGAFFEWFYSNLGYEMKLKWSPEETRDIFKRFPARKRFDLDTQRVKAVADMQFGLGAGLALTDGQLELVKSKTTGKIRNVLLDGKHVLSMRAHDGFFTLKAEGAKLLHMTFSKPALRIVVNEDSVQFNREGKNVMAKFVKECDDGLRPGDEVLIVDEKDRLVAVGRTRMNRQEMLAWDRGVAVEVREGIGCQERITVKESEDEKG
jgi:7-cyano-7-deazaguanine tRNA-ribosyltransferase